MIRRNTRRGRVASDFISNNKATATGRVYKQWLCDVSCMRLILFGDYDWNCSEYSSSHALWRIIILRIVNENPACILLIICLICRSTMFHGCPCVPLNIDGRITPAKNFCFLSFIHISDKLADYCRSVLSTPWTGYCRRLTPLFSLFNETLKENRNKTKKETLSPEPKTYFFILIWPAIE